MPAIAVHNFEEWLTMPYFPEPSPIFGSGLVAPSWQVMEKALVIVTLLPAMIIVWAATGLRRIHKDWAICWLSAIFFINVFVPHVLSAIMTVAYSPGLLSAVFVNLPLCLLLFRQAFVEGRVSKLQFSGAFTAGAISLPLFILLSFSVAELLIGS